MKLLLTYASSPGQTRGLPHVKNRHFDDGLYECTRTAVCYFAVRADRCKTIGARGCLMEHVRDNAKGVFL